MASDSFVPGSDGAIETYDALADFDPEDVSDTITDVANEIEQLPQRHSALWAVFNSVDKADNEALERYLEPEDRRQKFYDALTAYTRTLKVALSAVIFYEKTPERRIQVYKRDLKFFHNLRMSVKLRYAEAVDYREYERKIRKLLDDHIDASGVKQLTGEVEIFNREQFDEAVEQLASPRARAEAILNHLKRTAIERMETDPAYYREFSQMIDETLAAIEQERMSELEALQQASEMRDLETSGYRTDIPEKLRQLRDAPAYYGVVKETIQTDKLSGDDLAEMAIRIEELIEGHKIRDWENNPDVQNQMRNTIEDYLYEFEDKGDLKLTNAELNEIIEQVVDIARKRS